MRPALMFIGVVLTGGTGLALYLGNNLRKTKARAEKASAEIKQHNAEIQARRKLRNNWDNEHLVLSDRAFAGFKHETQIIGGIYVSCPKCKEL